MNISRNKLFLYCGVLLVILLMAVLYLNKSSDLEVSNLRIVNISNVYDGQQLGELTSFLNLNVVSGNQKILTSGDNLAPFADVNIVPFAGRNQFIQQNSFSISDPADNSQTAVLSDPSYQLLSVPKFTTAGSGQLYFHLNQTSAAGATSSIVINGNVHLARTVKDNWFIIENFPVVKDNIIALSSDSTISSAYLIIPTAQSQQASAGQAGIKQSKLWNFFDLSLPDNNFALVTMPANDQIVASQVHLSTDLPVEIFCSGNITPTIAASFCHDTDKLIYLIKKPSRYYLDSTDPTVISVFVTFLMILAPLFIVLGSYSKAEMIVQLQKAGNLIKQNYLWALLYLFWLDLLIILKIGPEIPVLSSFKFLLVMAVLPLIVYKKYSPRLSALIGVVVLSGGVLGYSIVRSDGIFQLVFVFIILVLLSLSIKELLKKTETDVRKR